jgi:hypothetical protein
MTSIRVENVKNLVEKTGYKFISFTKGVGKIKASLEITCPLEHTYSVRWDALLCQF